MPYEEREKPITTGDDAKRFIEREKEISQKRMEYAKKKAEEFEDLRKNNKGGKL